MQLGSAAALSTLVGCQGSDDSEVSASPSSGAWGVPRADQAFALLPESARPEGILELYALGGISPWETFYTVPEHCDPKKGGPFAGQQWWDFQDNEIGLTVPQWAAQCGTASMPLYEPFALDSAGAQVNLGPFVDALRDRPDMLKRMRIWVMHHEVEPHEVAIPLAMTGHALGNPRSTALGAHLQHYYNEQSGGTRTEPWSYAIGMSMLGRSNNGKAATSIGFHRASARPMLIQLGGGQNRLIRQLPRPGVAGYKAEVDALVRHYLERYKRRVMLSDQALRAPGVEDFAFVRGALENHEAFAKLIPPELLDFEQKMLCLPDPPPGAPINGTDDQTATAMGLARHFLTTPVGRAKYVQVLDQGIYPDPTGLGYDSHGAQVSQQAPNIQHLCRQLTAIVNQPGEGDPSKLDLDRHFIMINNEFGRAPYPEVTPRNPNGGGTDHWPWGYVVVGFGGFVDEDRAGVVGAIGEDGQAIEWLSPAEHRASLLLAMGIWPFSGQSFAVGDIRGASSELEAALILREKVLGYPA